MYNKRTLGASKEQIAANYLQEHGFQIIECNYYGRIGEIDLIAEDSEYLVFVEVKYRKDNKKGYPEEAITRNKMRTLVQMANQYLYRHGISLDRPCRFDVVVILGDEITLYKNAFDLNDAF